MRDQGLIDGIGGKGCSSLAATTTESKPRKSGALKYELLLLMVSIIWGSTFVAQQIGMQKGLGPMTFNGLRFALGCLVLVPVIVWRKKAAGRCSRGGEAALPGQLSRWRVPVCGSRLSAGWPAVYLQRQFRIHYRILYPLCSADRHVLRAQGAEQPMGRYPGLPRWSSTCSALLEISRYPRVTC